MCKIQPKKVAPNLMKEEKKALKDIREMPNKPESEDVIRMPDKGNTFVVVDKQTDIRKAEEQILKSSMEPLDDDLTQNTIN